MNIIINNTIQHFVKDDFPMIISGVDKSGASFFSILLLVDLYKNGEQVLLFSAYDAAKTEFRKHIDIVTSAALIIESGNEDNFIEILATIPNDSERIILCKNIEEYSIKLFDALKDKKYVIFSGNMDTCAFKDALREKNFETKIFFSYPECLTIDNKIDIPKYSAHIFSHKYNGLVSLGE